MNIYVGNLPYDVRDDELRAKFEAYGTVDSVEVIIDRQRNRSRGYGFVVMKNQEEARAAIAALDGADMHGRSLRVDESRPKTDDADRPRPNGKRSGAAPGRGRPRRAAGERRAAEPATAPRGGLLGFLRKLFS
jgi:RNA recognition motif-containing protein